MFFHHKLYNVEDYRLHENEHIIAETPYSGNQLFVTYKTNDDNTFNINIYKETELTGQAILSNIDNSKLCDILDKIKKYHEISKDYYELSFYASKKIDNYNLTIHKNANRNLTLAEMRDENGKWLAERVLHENPLQTFLALDGIWTFSGSSKMENEIIGKGYGKIIYDTIDSILGHHQIPHGYCMNGGMLTGISQKFWIKKSQERPIPPINTDMARKIHNNDQLPQCSLDPVTYRKM